MKSTAIIIAGEDVAGKSSAILLLLFGIQVGWIFTDLLSEDTRIGTVCYTRNKVRTTNDRPITPPRLSLATVFPASVRIHTT